MLELAENGYITATDLADYLVHKHGMSFRDAYRVTSLIVPLLKERKKKLHQLNINELKKIEPILTSDVLKEFLT